VRRQAKLQLRSRPSEELSPREEFSRARTDHHGQIATGRSSPQARTPISGLRHGPDRIAGEEMTKGIIKDAAFHGGKKARFQFPLLPSQPLTNFSLLLL
jgi:hypothetical protein